MLSTPKIPSITIRIWQYKCFFIADAFDETKQFRGDCLSFKRDDVDSFVAMWSDKAATLTVEDTTAEKVIA